MYLFCVIHEESCVWLERFDNLSHYQIQDQVRCELITEWAYEGQTTDEMESIVRSFGL